MWGGRRYSLKGIGEGEEAVDERFEQPRSATKWRRRVVARRCDENMTSFLYSVTCVRVHVQYTYSTALDHLRTRKYLRRYESTFVRRYHSVRIEYLSLCTFVPIYTYCTCTQTRTWSFTRVKLLIDSCDENTLSAFLIGKPAAIDLSNIHRSVNMNAGEKPPSGLRSREVFISDRATSIITL